MIVAELSLLNDILALNQKDSGSWKCEVWKV